MGIQNLEEIASEIVPEDEFKHIIDSPSEHTAYVGYEPSGVLHIGHMVTANAMIELQEMGVDIKILIADLHAELNQKNQNTDARDIGEKMTEQLKAFGLSDDTEFVYGSDFQMTNEYQKMVHKIAQSTTSSRAERSMAEISHGNTTKVSHLLYPVMQAADIWWLDADVAVGGMEQRKVHMMTRDIFPKLGISPSAFVHTPLIADLDTGQGKMSTSDGVSISSADSKNEVFDKINSSYCPTSPPEEGRENPVLQMYQYHIFPRNESIEVERKDEYGGNLRYEEYEKLESDILSGSLHPSDAKSTLSQEINKLLEPVRKVH